MESLSIVSHTNTLIKNRETIDIKLYEQFINYLDASPKTVETYKKSLKQMFSYFLSNNVTSPRREDLLAYRNYLFAKGLKPTTIQNYITAAKIFFTWTNEEGYYPNIAEHIKGAKIDKEHKKDYLTGAQVKNVLSCVDCGATQGLRDYAIIVLMITGGLRTVEVTRANIGDIRNIGESTVLFIQGKGKIEKNDYVKLPDTVEKAIRAYLSSRKDDKSDTSPLFVSGSNNNYGKRLSSRSVSGIVKEYLIKAGYDTPRLTAHSMRHTAVTLSLLAGKDITEVQQFARHESINTTMIYNHALDKEKNGCSEAISSSIF